MQKNLLLQTIGCACLGLKNKEILQLQILLGVLYWDNRVLFCSTRCWWELKIIILLNKCQGPCPALVTVEKKIESMNRSKSNRKHKSEKNCTIKFKPKMLRPRSAFFQCICGCYKEEREHTISFLLHEEKEIILICSKGNLG